MISKDKYISCEFQKYGYDLARALRFRKSFLDIKLAKEEPRQFWKIKFSVLESNVNKKAFL